MKQPVITDQPCNENIVVAKNVLYWFFRNFVSKLSSSNYYAMQLANTDLKISPYVCVHLNNTLKISHSESWEYSSYSLVTFVNFLKSRLLFNVFYHFCMFVNKHFIYLRCTYLTQWESMCCFHLNQKHKFSVQRTAVYKAYPDPDPDLDLQKKRTLGL